MMIILHAASGLGAFVLGLVCLSAKRVEKMPWLLLGYLLSLVGLLVFVGLAFASHFSSLDVVQRVMFSGLLALGIYMVLRGYKAWRSPGSPHYIDDIGFTLISLFDGFIIVLFIDLGFPPYLVVVAAIAAVIGGNQALHKLKHKEQRL